MKSSDLDKMSLKEVVLQMFEFPYQMGKIASKNFKNFIILYQHHF